VTTLALALALALTSSDSVLTDLRKLNIAPLEAKGWLARKDERRVILMCAECAGNPSVDVQLSTLPDGTEGRIRSGATTAESMRERCQANAARLKTTCHSLTASNVAGAVGFVSDVSLGERSHVATQTLWQDGYVLVIRVLSDSRDVAQSTVREMTAKLGSQIVHR
jgi:hypothetical protein